jgi:two-component system OmpR family sensor kinase
VAAVPLRVTLVAVIVALAALGLFCSALAVKTELERQLQQRVDTAVTHSMSIWEPQRGSRARLRVGQPKGNWCDAKSPSLPSTNYEWVTDAEGRTVRLSCPLDTKTNRMFKPVQPDRPDGLIHSVGSDEDGPIKWRILSKADPWGTTTIAAPLTDNIDTMQKLTNIELGSGLIVLALLGLVSFFVIRRSLRPLRIVESTARAIAAGDMNRRVPMRGTNTEVDQVAQALNIMLTQIQYGIEAIEASEEAAKRSESKMRRFIADASHELRTPLTTIRGFAELHRQGAVTDTVMLLNRIESESARMGLLVEDLLMLARLDAQRPLDRKPVDLLKLGGDAVHNARALATKSGNPDRQISLDVIDGVGTLEINGDQPRLQQVLGNLINNALTHTPPEAAITVRLVPFAEYVRVEVADTGPGLSEEAVERVFERFYRTDASRARVSGGTGLGLSIVQSLVEAHNGRVWVESRLGHGANFVVELPRDGVIPDGAPTVPMPKSGRWSQRDRTTVQLSPREIAARARQANRAESTTLLSSTEIAAKSRKHHS